MDPFTKTEKYKYPSESRFLTTEQIPGDINLKMGPIGDIVACVIQLPERWYETHSPNNNSAAKYAHPSSASSAVSRVHARIGKSP